MCAFAGNYNGPIEKFKTVQPIYPGSVGKPIAGCDVKIFTDDNQPQAPGEFGKIVIKLPLPPCCIKTLRGNDQAFF